MDALDFCSNDNSFRSCICIAFCNDWIKFDPFIIDRIIDVVTRIAPPITYVPKTKTEIIEIVIRVRSDIGFSSTILLSNNDASSSFSLTVSVSVVVAIVSESSNGVSSTAFCSFRKVSRNTAGSIIKKPR